MCLFLLFQLTAVYRWNVAARVSPPWKAFAVS